MAPRAQRPPPEAIGVFRPVFRPRGPRSPLGRWGWKRGRFGRWSIVPRPGGGGGGRNKVSPGAEVFPRREGGDAGQGGPVRGGGPRRPASCFFTGRADQREAPPHMYSFEYLWGEKPPGFPTNIASSQTKTLSGRFTAPPSTLSGRFTAPPSTLSGRFTWRPVSSHHAGGRPRPSVRPRSALRPSQSIEG